MIVNLPLIDFRKTKVIYLNNNKFYVTFYLIYKHILFKLCTILSVIVRYINSNKLEIIHYHIEFIDLLYLVCIVYKSKYKKEEMTLLYKK